MAAVTIKVRLDGPYKLSGPAAVRDARGVLIRDGDDTGVAVLCRCGRSGAPPACDGSHRRPAA